MKIIVKLMYYSINEKDMYQDPVHEWKSVKKITDSSPSHPRQWLFVNFLCIAIWYGHNAQIINGKRKHLADDQIYSFDHPSGGL